MQTAMKHNIRKYSFPLALMLALALTFSCSDNNDEVTIENGVTVGEASYTLMPVETTDEEGNISSDFYPALVACYYINADAYTIPSSAGFVYTTTPDKDPTLLDNVIQGEVSEKEVTTYSMARKITEQAHFISAKLSEEVLEEYGIIYVRAYYTAQGKTTYYSTKTLKLGSQPTDRKSVV